MHKLARTQELKGKKTLQQVELRAKNELQYRFPGVSSFEDNYVSIQLFRGREAEGYKLLQYILAETLTILFAASGYGKTSILQAYVFHRLREKKYYPLLVRFNQKEKSPQDVIKERLREAGHKPDYDMIDANPDGPPNEFLKAFKLGNISASSEETILFKPVLVFDQFEEIFTLEHNAPYRETFFKDLACILNDCREGLLNIKIVISIREDMLGLLEKMAAVIPSIFTNRFLLRPLSKENAGKAIIEPAEEVLEAKNGINVTKSFSFSVEAKQDLLNFLSLRREGSQLKQAEEIAPIQLQIICRELEEKVRNNQVQIINGRPEIGRKDLGGKEGMEEILGNFYEKQLEKLKTELNLDEDEIRAIRNLVETDLIAGKKRVPVDYDALITWTNIRKDGIDLLILNKLLKKEEHGNNSLVEISHDTLVDPILKTFKERTDEEEKAAIKKAEEIEKSKKNRKYRSILLISGLFTIIAVLFILQHLATLKMKFQTKIALQDKYFSVTQYIRKANPTIAYQLIKQAHGIDSSNSAINGVLSELNETGYSYTVQRLKVGDKVVYAGFLPNKEIIVASLNTVYKWKTNGLLDTSFTYQGIIIGAGKVNNHVLFVIHLTSNNDKSIAQNTHTAEVRDDNNVSLNKFTISSAAQNAAISHNGKYFIIGDDLFRKDKSSSILHFETWEMLRGTMSAVFSRDDKYIVSSFWTSDILVQDTTGKILKVFRHGLSNSVVQAIGMTSDFKSLVSACRTPIIKTWDISKLKNEENLVREYNERLKFPPGHASEINCIAISPDNKFILTGSNDNLAILWNWKGERVSILRGNTGRINYVTFCDDDDKMITGNDKGFVLLWKRGYASELEKSHQLFKFSPFEYRDIGLKEDKYSFDSLYNTSSFENKVVAFLDYSSSIPTTNAYPENKNYLALLDKSLKELDTIYNDIASSKEYINLSASNKKVFNDNYTTLIRHTPELLLKDQKDSNALNHLAKRLLIDTSQIDEAIEIAKEYQITGDTAVANSVKVKNYAEAIKYYEKSISILEAFYAKFKTNEFLIPELSRCYGTLAWYKIFVHQYDSAIINSRKGLDIDKTQEWIYTNLALGYLLSKKFKQAENIYFTHKDLKDSFLGDFKALRDGGILNDDTINKKIKKIEDILTK